MWAALALLSVIVFAVTLIPFPILALPAALGAFYFGAKADTDVAGDELAIALFVIVFVGLMLFDIGIWGWSLITQ